VGIINSFKDRLAIFSAPLALPFGDTFTLDGYATLGSSAHFELYFLNSLLVTTCSLVLILIVSSMAAFALAEYKFRFSLLTSLYLSIGIMVPIRLGTVGILRLIVSLHLVNTLWSLILIYTAQGIPLAVFADPAVGAARPRFSVSHIDVADLERSVVPSYPGAGRSHQNADLRCTDFLGRVRQ
jgi:ABC-type glycerol-3-phosphate transport system permease component